MMRRFIVVLGLVVGPALAAQDSAGPPPSDSLERGRLQLRIEQIFAERVRQQLGLTDTQVGKLRSTEERFRPRRQGIVRRQLALRFALAGQMRPGRAADADSVRQLMDGIQSNRLELLQLEQEQGREMQGYLTPVQQAQYQMLRERFWRRVAEVQRERLEDGDRVFRPRLAPRRRARP